MQPMWHVAICYGSSLLLSMLCSSTVYFVDTQAKDPHNPVVLQVMKATASCCLAKKKKLENEHWQ